MFIKRNWDKYPDEVYAKLRRRNTEVNGHENLIDMFPRQTELLSDSLFDILERHGGNVATITDAELVGAYEMIVDHVLPDAFILAYRPNAKRHWELDELWEKQGGNG